MTNLVLSPIDPSVLISSIAERTATEVIRKLLERGDTSDADQWFTIDELCSYHPDKPSKQTVYGWVSEGTIPVHKNRKKLRFLKAEIDQYLKEGKRKTYKEVAQNVESYFSPKTKKG